MDYLACEADCLEGLGLARAEADFTAYRRALRPLQEARRARRMLAADAAVWVGAAAPGAPAAPRPRAGPGDRGGGRLCCVCGDPAAATRRLDGRGRRACTPRCWWASLRRQDGNPGRWAVAAPPAAGGPAGRGLFPAEVAAPPAEMLGGALHPDERCSAGRRRGTGSSRPARPSATRPWRGRRRSRRRAPSSAWRRWRPRSRRWGTTSCCTRPSPTPRPRWSLRRGAAVEGARVLKMLALGVGSACSPAGLAGGSAGRCCGPSPSTGRPARCARDARPARGHPAESVEVRLLPAWSAPVKPGGTGVRTIEARYDEINAWFAVRLKRYLANQGVAWPDSVGAVMLAGRDGRPVLAFDLDTGGEQQILSLTLGLPRLRGPRRVRRARRRDRSRPACCRCRPTGSSLLRDRVLGEGRRTRGGEAARRDRQRPARPAAGAARSTTSARRSCWASTPGPTPWPSPSACGGRGGAGGVNFDGSVGRRGGSDEQGARG